MADKAITDLNTIPGSVDDNNTWFAVAQSGTAYKVSGHEFTLALGTILDGHGGIKTIVYTPPVAPSLTGTMVITLADNSTTTVSIQNGKGISSIAKTGTSGDLTDVYTITYNDSTTSTFSVTNGAKGETGDSWYVWIKYAGSQPTQDSDMGDTPDNWIGIYSGTSSTAPTHYTSYDWFEYKGEKGDTGAASTITTQNVSYQESSSGTVVPSGSWTTTIPTVPPGSFLWTRTQLAFNDGSVVTAYSVSRFGIDGTGSVSTVNSISPDGNGNVALTADDIPLANNVSVEDTIDQIETDVGNVNNLTTLATNCVDAINEVKTSLSTVKSDLGIVEDTNTATHAIAQGQYVIWKDALYKASQAIPIGTTLSSSNLTAVSDGGLNALSVGYGAGETITLSSTAIQATKDGMLVVNVDPGGSYIATYYVNDNTLAVTYVATSLAGAGSPATMAVPWIKGHNYRNTYKANASTIQLTLYPFEIK